MQQINDLTVMKSIQLEIMEKIHSFCEEKGIKYYLSHGSLIGAVRHQGFIPWDDDIDIFMPREDYEYFNRVFPGKQDELSLKAVNAYTDKYYGRPMTKVIDTRTYLIEPNYLFDDPIGVNVDIWPLDGVPNIESEKKSRLRRISFLLSLLYARIIKYSACRGTRDRIAHTLSIPFSAKSIVFKIDEELKKVPYLESSKVSCYVDPYKKEFDKSWFERRRLVSFEGKKFYIPDEADKVLTVLYGEYMKLPPVEKQKPHHVVNTFWID